MDVKAYGLTDVGRQRQHNEDSFLVADEAKLFLVAAQQALIEVPVRGRMPLRIHRDEARMLQKGDITPNTSGRQELLENLVNEFI